MRHLLCGIHRRRLNHAPTMQSGPLFPHYLSWAVDSREAVVSSLSQTSGLAIAVRVTRVNLHWLNLTLNHNSLSARSRWSLIMSCGIGCLMSCSFVYFATSSFVAIGVVSTKPGICTAITPGNSRLDCWMSIRFSRSKTCAGFFLVTCF